MVLKQFFMIIHFKSVKVNLETPADSTMLLYNLEQKVLKFCTFLATERLYHGFGTTLTPPLAPPRSMLFSWGKKWSSQISTLFSFWGRESICSCLCFQEFYLETWQGNVYACRCVSKPLCQLLFLMLNLQEVKQWTGNDSFSCFVAFSLHA